MNSHELILITKNTNSVIKSYQDNVLLQKVGGAIVISTPNLKPSTMDENHYWELWPWGSILILFKWAFLYLILVKYY